MLSGDEAFFGESGGVWNRSYCLYWRSVWLSCSRLGRVTPMLSMVHQEGLPSRGRQELRMGS